MNKSKRHIRNISTYLKDPEIKEKALFIILFVHHVIASRKRLNQTSHEDSP